MLSFGNNEYYSNSNKSSNKGGLLPKTKEDEEAERKMYLSSSEDEEENNEMDIDDDDNNEEVDILNYQEPMAQFIFPEANLVIEVNDNMIRYPPHLIPKTLSPLSPAVLKGKARILEITAQQS